MATDQDHESRKGIKNYMVNLRGIIVFVAQRFSSDNCGARAAALTFSSLLAIVPLLALGFAAFATFPAFDEAQRLAQSFLIENFVPHATDTVKQQLDNFVSRTGQLTAIGVLFLVLSSVLLLWSVTTTFNAIWRVRETRAYVTRLLVYWSVLTLTPLIFGMSLSVSSYLFAIAWENVVETYTGLLMDLAALLPPLLHIVGFWIVFSVIPNKSVLRSDALIGAVVAAVLFELLKKCFGLYIENFPTYQTIYGTLAVFPILLIWIYLAWTVVLAGAELVAALPAWRIGKTGRRDQDPSDGATLITALRILESLNDTTRSGCGQQPARLHITTELDAHTLTPLLETLKKHRYVAENENNEWFLVRDLNAVTLADLRNDLSLCLLSSDTADLNTRIWGIRFTALVTKAESAQIRILQIPLKELFNPSNESTIDDRCDKRQR